MCRISIGEHIYVHICVHVSAWEHAHILTITFQRSDYKLPAVQTLHYLIVISHWAVVEQQPSAADKDKYKLSRGKTGTCSFKQLWKTSALPACHKKLLQGVPVPPATSSGAEQCRACSLCPAELRGKSPESECSAQALGLTLKIAALAHVRLGLFASSLCLTSLTALCRRDVSGMYKSAHEALLCWLKHVQNKLCQILPFPSLGKSAQPAETLCEPVLERREPPSHGLESHFMKDGL